MKEEMVHLHSNRGTVLIMVVFVTALLSAVVIGLVQINTEEIQISQNHLHAAQAMAVAEAGLNAALAQLRAKGSLSDIAETSFGQGAYWVSMAGSSITANGRTAEGYVAKVQATVTVHSDGPPHAVDINTFKVNE
jgi:Tfp pilus assembly protein PilX